MSSREILIETIRVGNALRVNAVDAETGIEIMFQAPLHAGKTQLTQLASQKLRYVMENRKKKQQ